MNLQSDFSEQYRNIVFDREGRAKKAKKTLSVLKDYLGSLKELTLLDTGCSTGFMTFHYGQVFKRVIGIDIDRQAVQYASSHNMKENIYYMIMDSQNLAFSDNSFDVVTCTHVYEHVPEAEKLIAEIYRVLKKGGVCYFAAGNRFSLIEPHYKLPLLSVLPKRLAHLYLRGSGKGKLYMENHLTYWGLKKFVSRFEIIDYTFAVVKSPERFCATEVIKPGSFKQKLYVVLLITAPWICPTYLWLLVKQ